MDKILGIICLGVSATVFPNPILSYVLLIGLFWVAYKAKMLKIFSQFVVGFSIPILVMLFIIHGLFSPKNVTFIADFGFAKLGLEGIMYTIKLVGSLLVFLGSFLLFTLTTHPGKLVTALVETGMKPKAGYLILATFQIVPQMQGRLSIIQQAQMARGVEVEGNLLTRFAAFLPLIGPLVMGSLVDMQERGMTLETRGFGVTGVRTTSYVDVPDTAMDKLIRRLLVAFLVVTTIAGILMRVL
jgi:energy-coupling factor transport system permease protein